MADLQDAIAEVKRLDKISAPQEDEMHFFAVIWRSVASGDLTPRADAELAVAEAIRRAVEAAVEVLLTCKPNANAREIGLYRTAIHRIAPADALAEVQRLQARVTSLSEQVDTIATHRDETLALVEKLQKELKKR